MNKDVQKCYCNTAHWWSQWSGGSRIVRIFLDGLKYKQLSEIKPLEFLSMNSQYKKALRLEYFTVVYNIIEAIASITFGSLANSIALVGFGLDSILGIAFRFCFDLEATKTW